MKEKMGEAKWLIRAINKRNETVQNVGTLICQKQADFLSERSAELKPFKYRACKRIKDKSFNRFKNFTLKVYTNTKRCSFYEITFSKLCF